MTVAFKKRSPDLQGYFQLPLNTTCRGQINQSRHLVQGQAWLQIANGADRNPKFWAMQYKIRLMLAVALRSDQAAAQRPSRQTEFVNVVVAGAGR